MDAPKFSFNKEWYKSNRTRVLIATAALLVANDMFGFHLGEDSLQYVVALAMAFIGGKSIQDAFAAQAEVKGAAVLEATKLELGKAVDKLSPP